MHSFGERSLAVKSHPGGNPTIPLAFDAVLGRGRLGTATSGIGLDKGARYSRVTMHHACQRGQTKTST